MFNDGEIEIEGTKPKASSQAISTNEGGHSPSQDEPPNQIPTVSLPPLAIPVEFHVANGVHIVWAYPDMPKARPDLPTLYEVVTCPNMAQSFPQDEPDDNGFEWQTCARRTSTRKKTFPKTWP